jgi:hypothetical protein
MNRPQFSTLALAISLAFGIAACGGSSHNDDHVPPPTPEVPAMTPGDVFALTASNKLISFNRDLPGTVRTTATVTGLQSGENLLGIDFRPVDGKLYGVGSTGRLYTIDTTTGAATV